MTDRSTPTASSAAESPAPRSPYLLITAAVPLVLLLVMAGVAELVLRQLGYGGAVRYHYVDDLGWMHRPNQTATTVGRLPVRINEHGFRGPPVSLARTPDVERVLLVGDSFTFGYGVEEDSAFGAQIPRFLAARVPSCRVEVLNGGVNGYNSRQEAAFVRRVGARFRPDVVVVGFTPNDMLTRDESKALLRYPKLKGALAGSALYRFFAPRVKALLLPRDQQAYEEAIGSIGDEADSAALDRWAYVADALRDIAAMGATQGFRTIVVVFPQDKQVLSDSAPNWLLAKFGELDSAVEIEVVNLDPVLRAAARRGVNLFLDEPTRHPNAAGHRIAAEEIARTIAERGLLPGCAQATAQRLTAAASR